MTRTIVNTLYGDVPPVHDIVTFSHAFGDVVLVVKLNACTGATRTEKRTRKRAIVGLSDGSRRIWAKWIMLNCRAFFQGDY